MAQQQQMAAMQQQAGQPETYQVHVVRDDAGVAGYSVAMVGPVMIRNVDANRPDLHPLAVGDIILGVNGFSINSFEEYQATASGVREFALTMQKPLGARPMMGGMGMAPNAGMGMAQMGSMGMPQMGGMCNQMACMGNTGMAHMVAAQSPHGAAASEEVEVFLAQNNIAEKVANQFRMLAPELQKMVILRGELQTARDPTAVLVTRMRNATQGITTGNTQPQPGDWFCPGCSDHQFAKNTVCRRCGTPNPTMHGGMGMM